MTFWPHYCPVDRCLTETAEGEDCPWCGEREQRFSCDEPDPVAPAEPLIAEVVQGSADYFKV